MFKLPTWTKASANQIEKQFKLRYFTLIRDAKDPRINYYKTDDTYKRGGAPSGTIYLKGSKFERINKLDFVVTTGHKRLWCRAFSEPLADGWEEALTMESRVSGAA